MNPDCPYCWLKDGANIDHICDVVNVKKNLDTQWDITAETQRHLERCIHSKNTQVEKARRDAIEECAKMAQDLHWEIKWRGEPKTKTKAGITGEDIAEAIRNKLEKE